MRAESIDYQHLALRVLEDAPVLIVVLDMGNRIQHVNPFCERLTGYRLDEVRGKDVVNAFVPDEEHERLRDALARYGSEGAKTSGVAPLITRSGDVRQIDWTGTNIRDEEGRSIGLVAIGQDVTERVAAEEALRKRDVLIQAAVGAAPMAILAYDREGRFTLAQGSSVALLGLTQAQLLGRSAFELYKDAPGFVDHLRRALSGEEVATQGRRGSRFFDILYRPLRDADGGVFGAVALVLDVTERWNAEVQITASLREKETLLREIHHRVKNNLQVISSLLHFQSKKLRSPEDGAAFAELRQRIYAMTLVHERLYKSPDVARVDLGDYVPSLVAELTRSIRPRPGVRIDVATDDVRLPIELALPSGMIVCELITNVLKYAFPGAREGTAVVSVRRAGDRIVIAVDDDGVGFPPGFDVNVGSSFGWELIRSLVLQLDGVVEATTNRGAHVRVSFAVPLTGGAS